MEKKHPLKKRTKRGVKGGCVQNSPCFFEQVWYLQQKNERGMAMWIDFFHYDLSVSEEKREITLFVKVSALQLTNEMNDTWLFNPRKNNTIILDLHTGNVKNPHDVFCFFSKSGITEDYTIHTLCEQVTGFPFELEQAYEKALFYRVIRSKNANTR